MNNEPKILIDAAKSFSHRDATIRGTTPQANWQVTLRTLRGGRSEGVQVVEIDNGIIAVDVIPTRGMGIWRVRRGWAVLGWRSPAREPVHPAFVPLFDPSGLGWLEGFNELLCRCGLETNGAPDFDEQGRLVHPVHGRIANLPAHRVELVVDDENRFLKLRGIVEESRFHFQNLALTTTVTVSMDSAEFSWHDEVANIGGRPATLQMLYHFNVGQPLLVPGTRITAPIREVAPIAQLPSSAGSDQWNQMPAARPGSPERVYCFDLLADASGDTRVLVSELDGGQALGMRFNKRALPCFIIWKNFPSEVDGYVMGIEPSTNFPNRHTFEKEQGRVVPLLPGETWSAKVDIAWHTTQAAIAADEEAIRALQGDLKCIVHDRPRAGWSASI